MRSLCILTRDIPFAEFIRLTLDEHIPQITVCENAAALPEADAYIVDLDTAEMPVTGKPVLLCGWGRERPEGAVLWAERPFRPARLRALLGLTSDTMTECPTPAPDRQAVWLSGREIPLSDCEYRLFCLLYEAGGRYVPRSELHEKIWHGEGDDGVVNVYIHYLRRKLEADGHTRLRSARGRGYALLREEEPEC